MTVEWELDHIFLALDPRSEEGTELVRRGLEPSYRRDHPGQGTQNLCFCFDNAYLELLWTRDKAELAANALVRSKLPDRMAWPAKGVCPFGIAIRPVQGQAELPELPFKSWAYRPSYLPQGTAIQVATMSDDARLPFLFHVPGSKPPAEWPDGLAGTRQLATGLVRIVAIRLHLKCAPIAAMAKVQKALPWFGVNWKAQEPMLDIVMQDGSGALKRMPLPFAPPVEG